MILSGKMLARLHHSDGFQTHRYTGIENAISGYLKPLKQVKGFTQGLHFSGFKKLYI